MMQIRTTDTDVLSHSHSVSCGVNHYFIAAMIGSIQGVQKCLEWNCMTLMWLI